LKCARDHAVDTIKDQGVRTAAGDLVIYASEQCHYSIDKSADILGLGRNAMRKIPTDERFHINLEELRKAIGNDLHAGRVVCCIVGVAGTTSTGVIDPLEELGQIAEETGCWYHIDAAYGGPLAFSNITSQTSRNNQSELSNVRSAQMDVCAFCVWSNSCRMVAAFCGCV
jgi:aromatic-L-amino-acid decarboxylase